MGRALDSGDNTACGAPRRCARRKVVFDRMHHQNIAMGCTARSRSSVTRETGVVQSPPRSQSVSGFVSDSRRHSTILPRAVLLFADRVNDGAAAPAIMFTCWRDRGRLARNVQVMALPPGMISTRRNVSSLP